MSGAAGSTNTTPPSDSSQRKWNIKETNVVNITTKDDGSIVINEYCTTPTVLGTGAFGKVTLVTRESNGSTRSFAMKQMNKAKLRKIKTYINTATDGAAAPSMAVQTQLDKVNDEIQIMRNLFHKNIVILFEVLQDDQNIWYILEYMTKGPLLVFDSSTKRFKSPMLNTVIHEDLAKKHLSDIVNGLKYLHSLGIAHRDIKPANILLNDDGRCHLADFGCAKRFDNQNDLCSDTSGTFHFVAPECCGGPSYSAFKADIWAVGVTLYCMLCGSLPFDGDSTKELFENIQRHSAESTLLPDDCDVSDECIDLISSILTPDPALRISLQEILEHPWLTEDAPSF